jgi:genome maintenance exonuclease 1
MFNYCPPCELPTFDAETGEDGKRYYNIPNGEKYPSITTILSALSKDSIAAWRRRVGEQEANRVSQKASSRGTKIHSIVESYLNNDPDYIRDVMPNHKETFLTIRPLLNKIDNIWYQECALYSDTLKVAGRVDCIGEYDGVLSIIDFKTSSRVKKKEDITSYFLQTTFYALALEEMIGNPVDQLVIIMSVDDHDPLVFVEKTENYIDELVKVVKQYGE